MINGNATHYFILLGLWVLLTGVWQYTRKQKGPAFQLPERREIGPIPVLLGPFDYLKALLSWVFLFGKIGFVQPGLYYIGERDESAPLLVTCNNFLTLFLLVRRIGKRASRLLVIDTAGVNVWCSAGKGKFSAEEILRVGDHFDLFSSEKKEKLVLPKFSLSGVRLQTLKDRNISPIIGPLYAKDLPYYLDEKKYRNCTEDVVNFGIQARTFTALPTAIQFLYYVLALYVVSLGHFPVEGIGLVTVYAFLYPVLFSWLPFRWFVHKALVMGLLSVPVLFLLSSAWEFVAWTSFSFATLIFIALSYTGNSAVSNYTEVRKETARFLPVSILLYLLAFVVALSVKWSWV